MLSLLARAAIVVSAGVIAAWLLLGIHQVDLQTDAEAKMKQIHTRHFQVSQVEQARSELRRADRYNPDLTPLLDQAYLHAWAGQRETAFALALKAATKEPENVQTWTVVYLTAPNTQIEQSAQSKVRALNPWLADSLRSPLEGQ